MVINKNAEENNSKNINIKNLGGWLMAIQVFILLNTIYWLKRTQIFYELFNEKDSLLKAQNISNPSLSNAFIYYEFFIGIFFTILSLIVVYLFFKKIRYFSNTMIVYLIFQVIAETAPYFIFKSIIGQQDALWPLILGTIAAVLIIVYLKMSVRVKLTFIQ